MLVTKITNDKNLITEMALNGEPVACEALFDLLAVQWRHLAKMKHAYTVLCFEDVESIARCTMFEALAAFAKNGNSPLFAKFAGYFGTAFKHELVKEMREEIDYRNLAVPADDNALPAVQPAESDSYPSLQKTLTPSQWRAVELFYLQGYNEKETARKMDRSERQVRRYLAAARQKLKNLL